MTDSGLAYFEKLNRCIEYYLRSYGHSALTFFSFGNFIRNRRDIFKQISPVSNKMQGK
mgnify:CR=1 FL=1